jgi:hypothetical protein
MSGKLHLEAASDPSLLAMDPQGSPVLETAFSMGGETFPRIDARGR